MHWYEGDETFAHGAADVANDAIDRAIKRGMGEAGGGTYESITYEGYAPGGVGLLVDAS